MRKVIIFLCLAVPLDSWSIITTPSIVASQIVKKSDLTFFKELFESRSLLKSMECEIRTKSSQAIRKFKDRSDWVETLELSYLPYRYDSNLHATILLSASGVKYGSRTISHLELGPLEEFRIEFNDSKESFIEFSHDGSGHLTSFLFGDIYRLYPCRMKR